MDFQLQSLLSFKFSELNNSNPIVHHEYERETLHFCQQWQAGKEFFEITTSGSTGKPKTISLTRQQMIKSAEMTCRELGLQPGNKALVCLNTRYIGGKMMLVRGMVQNMEMTVVPPVSNPLKRFSSDIRFDFTALVPFQMQTILEETPEKVVILNKMKATLLGGAPVSEYLEEKVQKIESPVYSTYGMTETVSHIALRKLNGKDSSRAYKVLHGIEISSDQENRLYISGEVTNGIKLKTNDIVKLIDDKTFIWLGRADNVINSGGVKIQIEDLEKKIDRIFNNIGIKNRFFITGAPDLSFGTAAVLFIERKLESEQKERLLNSLQQDVSKYEIPKKILEVEKFIETGSGKIDRIATKTLIY